LGTEYRESFKELNKTIIDNTFSLLDKVFKVPNPTIHAPIFHHLFFNDGI